jgi:hypothetical protein
MAQVTEVADALHGDLPDALITLLGEQNGGWVRYDGLPVSTGLAADGLLIVDHMRGIGSPGGLVPSPALARELQLPKPCLLLAATHDGALILDGRGDDGPVVTWLERPGTRSEVVAPSFACFVEALVDSRDEHVVGLIEVDDSEVDFITAKLGALGADFAPDGDERVARVDAWMDRRGESPAELRLRRHVRDQGRDHFVDHDDADWILECDLDDARMAWLMRELEALDEFEFAVLHRPWNARSGGTR